MNEINIVSSVSVSDIIGSDWFDLFVAFHNRLFNCPCAKRYFDLIDVLHWYIDAMQNKCSNGTFLS